MTQRDLGERVGVSSTMVSLWENGREPTTAQRGAVERHLFRSFLAVHRTRLQLGQAQVGAVVGLGPGTVSNWVSGNTTPTLEQIGPVRHALGHAYLRDVLWEYGWSDDDVGRMTGVAAERVAAMSAGAEVPTFPFLVHLVNAVRVAEDAFMGVDPLPEAAAGMTPTDVAAAVADTDGRIHRAVTEVLGEVESFDFGSYGKMLMRPGWRVGKTGFGVSLSPESRIDQKTIDGFRWTAGVAVRVVEQSPTAGFDASLSERIAALLCEHWDPTSSPRGGLPVSPELFVRPGNRHWPIYGEVRCHPGEP